MLHRNPLLTQTVEDLMVSLEQPLSTTTKMTIIVILESGRNRIKKTKSMNLRLLNSVSNVKNSLHMIITKIISIIQMTQTFCYILLLKERKIASKRNLNQTRNKSHKSLLFQSHLCSLRLWRPLGLKLPKLRSSQYKKRKAFRRSKTYLIQRKSSKNMRGFILKKLLQPKWKGKGLQMTTLVSQPKIRAVPNPIWTSSLSQTFFQTSKLMMVVKRSGRKFLLP